MFALLLLFNEILPFVLFLVGSILKKHPVREMNSQNGYVTPTSCKSPAHWNYAQSLAPDIFLSVSKGLAVAEAGLSLLLRLLRIPVEVSVGIGAGLGSVVMWLTFLFIDSRIEAHFTKL